jgi:hypothetical protein
MWLQAATDTRGEWVQKLPEPWLELLERVQCVTECGFETEAGRRLVQKPESLGEVCVELKELPQRSLGDLLGGEMELVQRPKQRQQLQTGTLQAGAKVSKAMITRSHADIIPHPQPYKQQDIWGWSLSEAPENLVIAL